LFVLERQRRNRRMSLFPTSLASSKNLVEFKAGKLFRDGNMLKPDTRKGLVYMFLVSFFVFFFLKKFFQIFIGLFFSFYYSHSFLLGISIEWRSCPFLLEKQKNKWSWRCIVFFKKNWQLFLHFFQYLRRKRKDKYDIIKLDYKYFRI